MKTSTIYKIWQYLCKYPFGPYIFSFLIRFINPYTGALRAQVQELKPGYARIRLRDRRSIRNHLDSIHAIALINLGEFTSGLALLASMDDSLRGIPIKISVEYFKKARGTLIAESYSMLPDVVDETEFTLTTDIKDQQNTRVAMVQATWKISKVEN